MGGRSISFAILGLASAAMSQAATISSFPYSNNFDSFADNTNVSALFVENNSGSSNSEFFGGNLRQSASGTGVANSSASVDVAAGTFTSAGGFSTTTTFTIDQFTLATGVVNVSLSGNGTDANLGSGTAYRLIYTLSTASGVSGGLALQETNAATGLTGTLTSTTGIAPVVGNTYTLTLVGTYINGGTALSLVGTLTSGSTTLTVGGTDTSPTNGTNFGIRTALNGAGGTGSSETITFTNFGLAVPEPTSTLLFAFTGGVLALRRKRA